MSLYGALWLEPAFLAWRNHTGWSVTTANGLTVWHCCHGTLGAAPLGTSQWSTLWETLICSRVPSPVPVPLRLQLSEKNKYSSLSSIHDFFSSGTGNTWTHECQHPGVLGTNRKTFDTGDDGPPWNDVLFPALVGHRPTLQRGMPIADTFAISEPAS